MSLWLCFSLHASVVNLWFFSAQIRKKYQSAITDLARVSDAEVSLCQPKAVTVSVVKQEPFVARQWYTKVTFVAGQ